jgi:competence protein ComEC
MKTFTALCVLFGLSANLHALQHETNSLFVRVIDVGAGLSCVLKLPDGRHIIYDAGERNLATNQIARLIPRNSDIELLVLSHSDSDHLGATPFICTNYHVKHIIHSGLIKPKTTNPLLPTDAWRAATNAIAHAVSGGCEELNLASAGLVPGRRFDYGPVTVTFVFGLHKPMPEWGFNPITDSSEYYNSGSVVVRVAYRGQSILFCGDTVGRHINDDNNVCIAAEREMVRNAAAVPLDSDIIIAPHHGADNGSSLDFIRAVTPRVVIFSAGSDFKHPRLRTVNRYKSVGVEVTDMYRTDLGDRLRSGEWSRGSKQAGGDRPGDDHVDILIRNDGTWQVNYWNL